MPTFAAHIGWTFATRLLMIFNSVAAGIIVAWWLGAEGVGQLAVINVAVTTIVQLGSFGLPSSNTYFIAQDQSQFRIAALSIPFQLITLIGLNILLAVGKVREFNLLDLAGQSFVLINAVLVLLLLKRGLETLITINTLASILVAVVIALLLVISARTLTHSKWRADVALLRRMIFYGLKFHISILAGAIIIRADLLVVNHFRGAAEAGVYSVASQFALLLMLLPGVIATLLFPRVTTEQDARGETTCLVS